LRFLVGEHHGGCVPFSVPRHVTSAILQTNLPILLQIEPAPRARGRSRARVRLNPSGSLEHAARQSLRRVVSRRFAAWTGVPASPGGVLGHPPPPVALPWRAGSIASNREIKRALDRVRARCDLGSRRDADPVGFVHRYEVAEDQEIVALLAASVAFGNVKAIRAKLEDALRRLGPRPSLTADDQVATFAAMHGWVHRVYRGEDIARLVIGARRVQRASGTLGARFTEDLGASPDLREALARFCDAIRNAGGLAAGDSVRRGPSHLLPDPRGGGANKRLLLFLRWMVRPADGVDLGLWRNVDPSVLVIPVDVHIHKLAKNLGLVRQKTLSFKTAEEITERLRMFDPNDPVKYDFSLCHMGMLQRCPSRRDDKRCEGCGVMPVCRHWHKPPR
jgi:uncharacterized protein (TIGR02757 family)